MKVVCPFCKEDVGELEHEGTRLTENGLEFAFCAVDHECDGTQDDALFISVIMEVNEDTAEVKWEHSDLNEDGTVKE